MFERLFALFSLTLNDCSSSWKPGRWCWSWPDKKWSLQKHGPSDCPYHHALVARIDHYPTKWQLLWARRKLPGGPRPSLLWKLVTTITSCLQGTVWTSPWTKLLSTGHLQRPCSEWNARTYGRPSSSSKRSTRLETKNGSSRSCSFRSFLSLKTPKIKIA